VTFLNGLTLTSVGATPPSSHPPPPLKTIAEGFTVLFHINI
jgi:hypothetical protein